MESSGITRNILRLISKNSNLSQAALTKALVEEGIYADRRSWSKFLELVALSLGAAFCLAGLIFFLAYNWHLMHKFLKLGLVQALLLVVVAVVVLRRDLRPLARNLLILSASVLVGAMFSVFGQIYQTGADAYDFFLGWTVFVVIWTIAANFYPLWVLLLTLINVTFLLYISQVGPAWRTATTFFVLFAFNAVVLHGIQLEFIPRAKKTPIWFARLIELSVAFCITVGVADGIDTGNRILPLFLTFALASYAYSCYKSSKNHQVFSWCVSSFSLIILVCFFITEISDDAASFFVQAIFVIVSVTLLIRWLVSLNRKWNEIS